MAKFHGSIGYATFEETSPDVHTEVISEREYFGEVIRESRQWTSSGQVNDNLTLSNRITILADDFAYGNCSNMRYVIWAGTYWKISSIEVQRPRLILSIGGVYNGPKA